MSDPSVAIQGATYEVLSNDTVLAGLMGGTARIYDIVPPDAYASEMAYITIGEDQILDNGNSCEADIFEVFSTLHIWSRSTKVGRIEAKKIAERARDILKALPAVPGFQLDGAHLERLDHLRDPDGVTAHSILVMRYLLATTA